MDNRSTATSKYGAAQTTSQAVTDPFGRSQATNIEYGYAPDNTGGYNFYAINKVSGARMPITREIFASKSGYDPTSTSNPAATAATAPITNTTQQNIAQTTPQVDTYAQQLATAQSNFRNELPSALSQIYESAGTKVGSDITGLKTAISDTMKTAGRKAEGYGLEQKQAEMNRIQGIRDVLGMTSRGLQSGAKMLAGKNAGSSSAVEALTKAYEQLGARELGKIMQTYQLGQETRNINTANLAQDINEYLTVTLPQAQDTIINNIVETTRAKVAELRAAAVNASLPDLVNIDNEIARVKADAQARLGDIKGFVETEKQKYTGKVGTVEQARTGAQEALNIATNTPSPISGALPIYTRQGA